MSNSEKADSQRLAKQIERQSGETASAVRDRDRLTAQVDTLEDEIIELKEQVGGAWLAGGQGLVCQWVGLSAAAGRA